MKSIWKVAWVLARPSASKNLKLEVVRVPKKLDIVPKLESKTRGNDIDGGRF